MSRLPYQTTRPGLPWPFDLVSVYINVVRKRLKLKTLTSEAGKMVKNGQIS